MLWGSIIMIYPVVVSGMYDHIHQVLENINIKFITVTQEDLYPLRKEQAVYINCPNSFLPDVGHYLRKFVENGGQLITIDWALVNVLQIAFPEKVRASGGSESSSSQRSFASSEISRASMV
ncbi:unnamed protein product, partial [Didymodactylos carnosus]